MITCFTISNGGKRIARSCAHFFLCLLLTGCETVVRDRNGNKVFSTIRGVKNLDVAVWDGTKIHADELQQLSTDQITALVAALGLFAK